MSWAARRRLLIVIILGLFATAVAAVIFIATIYKAPSCFDNVQNQDESGIDCGGSCSKLCTAQVQPPTVLFTKAFSNGFGGTNVVALVQNQNTNAYAKAVPYALTVYAADQTIIYSAKGTVDLPPSTSVPIFVSGIQTGNQVPSRVFLSIDSAAPDWQRAITDTRVIPVVSNTTIAGTAAAPTITSTLTNPSTTVLSNVLVVVMVRDAAGNVIAASQTVVPTIGSLGSAQALFTWTSPFTALPASTQVMPVIPLP